MNKELWGKIAQFDFVSPPSEYGFSTRLANENYWIKNFTKQAILEYQKVYVFGGNIRPYGFTL